MPTIPIVPENAAPAPLAVVASNITEAKLIAAYAEWDGSGASGDFLPCLAIYSQAGVRLGRVFPSSPVAAGDDAVVTYAPFPGGLIQKASPATPGIGDFVSADTKAPPQSIVDSPTETILVFNDGVTGGGGGTVTLDPDQSTFRMTKAGLYGLSLNVLWTNGSQTGVRAAVLATAVNNLDNAIETFTSTNASSPTNPTAIANLYSWVGAFSANGSVSFGVVNDGGLVPVDIDYAQATVALIAPLGS